MIAIEFDFDTKQERPVPIDAVRASCDAGKFCWVDVDAAADPAAVRALLGGLGVNEHAIDETLGPDVDGRHDLYDDCLHIAVTSAAVDRSGPAPKFISSHVDLIMGERFMVTVRRGTVEFLEQVRRHYRQDFIKFARTPSFLLYECWDHLIDGFKKAFRALEARVERVQGQILGAVDDTIFNDAAEVTRDMLWLRKVMLACREVLHELTTRRTPFVSETALPSLERLAAALERLVSDITVEREALAETLNLYMGIVSHRTNKVVNRLTVISMVFLPLTFLVGVYGMNFDPDAGPLSMPELKWPYSYLVFWVVAIGLAVGLLTYMKRRNWW